jgi:hypothetical protein
MQNAVLRIKIRIFFYDINIYRSFFNNTKIIQKKIKKTFSAKSRFGRRNGEMHF